METSFAPDCVYRIDATHRIVFVGGNWVDFARCNHGDHLVPDKVLGRSIWEFITEPTTIEIYRALVARVVSRASLAEFGFRCDGPEVRRHMWMEVTRAADGTCQFTSTVIRQERRTFIPLVDPQALRESQKYVTVCSWCKRVAVPDSGWVEVERAVGAMGLFGLPRLPQLTHGICPPCQARFQTEIDYYQSSHTRGACGAVGARG